MAPLCRPRLSPRARGQRVDMVPKPGQADASGPSRHRDQGELLSADVDLASRWVGSSVLLASDESFGEKENLLNTQPAAFEPGHFGNRGEIVDGWETRRRREPGNDWALVRLGTPGVINSVDVDTSFFTGNFPQSFSLEACGREAYPSPQEILGQEVEWDEIVPTSPLRGDTHNTFSVVSDRRYTHVKLSAFPDGGIARLRVLGRVVADPRHFDGLTIDLASQEHGGAVVASSDDFYTSAGLLNRPDSARTMGEGWETRRRRDEGPDRVVFRLALAGRVRQLVLDTAHFKYNASAAVSIFGAASDVPPASDSPVWIPLVPRTRLQPDTRHVVQVGPNPPSISYVRLDAYPDGGLSRLRAIGDVDPAARREAGLHFFNSLPPAHAIQCLLEAGVGQDPARRLAHSRPFAEGWRERLEGGPDGFGAQDLDVVATILDGNGMQASR